MRVSGWSTDGVHYGRKRHAAEGIVNKLRRAKVESSKGLSVASMCKLLGMPEWTYYRCRKE